MWSGLDSKTVNAHQVQDELKKVDSKLEKAMASRYAEVRNTPEPARQKGVYARMYALEIEAKSAAQDAYISVLSARRERLSRLKNVLDGRVHTYNNLYDRQAVDSFISNWLTTKFFI